VTEQKKGAMAIGKFTHAIVSRVPKSFQNVPTLDGTCIDLEKAREQHQYLVQVLRNLDLDVLELPPDEDNPFSVFVSDCAFIVNGIALMCKPAGGKRQDDVNTIKAVLKKEVGVTCEEHNSNNAFISGSDILFTGSEFFVGIGEETNTNGALGVANTWPEYSCTPIQLEGSKHLTDRMTMAGVDLLAVGSSSNCQILLKRIEREANNRYHTLTVPEDDAANSLFINNCLLIPHSNEIPLSSEVFKNRINSCAIKEVALSEFQKTGRGLSSLCLLIRKSRNIKRI